MKRVVITGVGAVTSLGDDWQTIQNRLRQGVTAIRYMPEWDRCSGLNTRLGAPVTDFVTPVHFTRKQTRSMGRVALLAASASERAVRDAGLLDADYLKSGHVGIAYGSSAGSPAALGAFAKLISEGDCSGITANSYLRMMGHTCAVNVALYFGLTGRLIPASSACTSGSQALGFAYETIQHGKQEVMLAGGAEELDASDAVVFDTLYATSTRNDAPSTTPRPFDENRDGLVCGEGATTLIVEELEHARRRSADILAEVVGFGCNSDGAHVTRPQVSTMRRVMELALQDAALQPEEIGYICAHGTATRTGDSAESHATQCVFGSKVAISSLKGHFGHTLGACGALEAWLSMQMMRDDWFAPTANLSKVASDCKALDYISGEGRTIHTDYIMSNNFAFGGINTSLIIKRY